MLRRVNIVDPGDTRFIKSEQVERADRSRRNDRTAAEGRFRQPTISFCSVFTKASLSTDSFISAASFQETTRVLTKLQSWASATNFAVKGKRHCRSSHPGPVPGLEYHTRAPEGVWKRRRSGLEMLQLREPASAEEDTQVGRLTLGLDQP